MAQSHPKFRDEALAVYDLSTAIQSGSIPLVISHLSRPLFSDPSSLNQPDLDNRLLLSVAWRSRASHGLLSLGLLLEKGADVEAYGLMGRWVEWEVARGEAGEKEEFLGELERAKEGKRGRERGGEGRYRMREGDRMEVERLCEEAEEGRRMEVLEREREGAAKELLDSLRVDPTPKGGPSAATLAKRPRAIDDGLGPLRLGSTSATPSRGPSADLFAKRPRFAVPATVPVEELPDFEDVVAPGPTPSASSSILNQLKPKPFAGPSRLPPPASKPAGPPGPSRLPPSTSQASTLPGPSRLPQSLAKPVTPRLPSAPSTSRLPAPLSRPETPASRLPPPTTSRLPSTTSHPLPPTPSSRLPPHYSTPPLHATPSRLPPSTLAAPPRQALSQPQAQTNKMGISPAKSRLLPAKKY